MAPYKVVVAVAAWSVLAQAVCAGAPEAAFRTPERVKRPETYFFFFGGNVAAPGITADLEAVKSAGIKFFNGNSARGAWSGVRTNADWRWSSRPRSETPSPATS